MENTKVNSNKLIAFKNTIKNVSVAEWILISTMLLCVIALICMLQFLIRDAFFADSLLYNNDNLLVEYQDEVQEHNLPVFYEMASQLLENKSAYNTLVIYKVLDNKTVQKFNLNDFPLSLKILKRHKEGWINDSVYLVDLTYVHKDNNNYTVKHSNVILKTDDLYYLEYDYHSMIHQNYESDHHNIYVNNVKKDSELTDSMKKNAIDSLNTLNSVVSQK